MYGATANIETTRAVLVCEGKCSAATEHEFKEKRPIGQEGMMLGGYKLIYGCTQCGTFRIWGVEAP